MTADLSSSNASTTTAVKVADVEFVKELYPRLREDDAAIERYRAYWCVTHRDWAWRMWKVRPDDVAGGWMGGSWDIRSGHGWWTCGGWLAEDLLAAMHTWGLSDHVLWSVDHMSSVRDPGSVYLIGTSDSGTVKIGRSKDVPRRLADIQRMSPVQLAVLWQTPGGAELEARLHRAFADRRSHGEWFDFGDDDPIANVCMEVQR